VVSATAVVALRWIPPPTTSFMLQHKYAAAESAEVNYRWVDWRHISPYAAVAVIAAEDQRFAEHNGFDVEAIRDALEERMETGRVRGASTITQQVSKNVFLWPGQSWVRKGLEAYFTVLVELLWPKRRILEVYLNVAQFGPSTFGVGAASKRFFDKPAADLSVSQSALLAAVLPNPARLLVERPSAYVKKRVAWVSRQIDLLGGVAYLERHRLR
jgi:monofunctional biosynthetic peptidoglycan transglycosylase